MNFDTPDLSPETQQSLQTPCLLVWPERVDANIRHMIEMAGAAQRLRPHCKTHKMGPVAQRLVAAGITRHKAATVVEVQMLCQAGATDVVLAGNAVGPVLDELVRLATTFPAATLAITADAEGPVRRLAAAAEQAQTSIGVMIDLDVGLHRTGLLPGSDEVIPLYQLVQDLPGVTPAGLHIYDGHQHQTDLQERRNAIMEAWRPVAELLPRLDAAGLPVPELLCGGTPSFPVYAEFDDPRVSLSPGTCTLHDVGYGRMCPDIVFEVAAAVATRVVSCTVPGQLTLDVGHKAIAGDPPAGRRVYLPALPDAEAIIHNEEHLTVRSAHADRYQSGDLLIALPIHICPTVALHELAVAIKDGQITDRWPVARHRLVPV